MRLVILSGEILGAVTSVGTNHTTAEPTVLEGHQRSHAASLTSKHEKTSSVVECIYPWSRFNTVLSNCVKKPFTLRLPAKGVSCTD